MRSLVIGLIVMLGVTAGSYETDHREMIRAHELISYEQIQREQERKDVLWLARVVYSETKYVHEQEKVAWVVRNRVETEYQGSTYKEVALAGKQFSGLNDFDPHYERNISMSYDSLGTDINWDEAVEVARFVYNAPDHYRPFDKSVRHFYSPVAMEVRPFWAEGEEPIHIIKKDYDEIRFAFYDNIN